MFSLHPLYQQLAHLVEQELLLGTTPAIIREKLCVSDRFIDSQYRRLAGRHRSLPKLILLPPQASVSCLPSTER